jgi:hypothetical protein
VPPAARSAAGLPRIAVLDGGSALEAQLDANPNEPDRDQQRAQTEHAIELAAKAAEFFPST